MKKKIFIVAVIGVVVDQLSKLLIVNTLDLYQSIKVIPNFFNISYIRNNGAAWGMLDNNIFLLIGITLVAIFLIVKYILKEDKLKKIDTICYGMLLGGILGNFIDRIIYNYVIDFFDFKIFSYNFPVFNVADTLIVVSVIIMLIITIGRKDESNSK